MQLRDGRSVWVREIQPDDKDGLQAAVGHLSVQSRYMRFMATVKALSEPMLEKATHPLQDREFALLAVNDDVGAECIGAGAQVEERLSEEVEPAALKFSVEHRGGPHRRLRWHRPRDLLARQVPKLQERRTGLLPAPQGTRRRRCE
ncbi:hypothetical protein [Variovorax rhizosphaerae]|uniref:N-acetyltransferase n=1 Tax=Variovorax rhizosphaerae TaxID=1836200 RepID=A0ABU8WZU3_9BURK